MKWTCVVGLLSVACASSTTAGPRPTFEGEWIYRRNCRFGHYVDLDLHQKGKDIIGSWGDGTRVWGENGSLKGEVRDGKAYLRFCNEGDSTKDFVCPDYGQESAHLERDGETLVWYRKYPQGPRRYVTLYPSGEGRTAPAKDDDCAGDDT